MELDGAPRNTDRSVPELRVTSERGTVTIWILGLCMMLFLLGGISLDLWRAFSERRALAAAADAAALTGSAAIDEAVFRSTGVVQLDPVNAERRARESLAAQLDVEAMRDADVTATLDAVLVEVHGEVDFTLLSLVDPGEPLEIRVAATSRPVRSP